MLFFWQNTECKHSFKGANAQHNSNLWPLPLTKLTNSYELNLVKKERNFLEAQFTQRIKKRLLNPLFRIPNEERDIFLSNQLPDSFKATATIKNESVVELFGIIDQNQVPPQISALKYTTELTGEALAMVDVMVEFSNGKDIKDIDSLGLREIENFLRDSNTVPAFSGGIPKYYPLFETIKNELKKILTPEIPNRPEGERASPNINRDYSSKKDYFPFKGKDCYQALNSNEKLRLVDQIIRDHISRPLAVDHGSVFPIFADDGMVVIQYGGSCSSCRMALTSTMSFIQKVMQLETLVPELLVMTDS